MNGVLGLDALAHAAWEELDHVKDIVSRHVMMSKIQNFFKLKNVSWTDVLQVKKI